jgi:hypothetical protein
LAQQDFAPKKCFPRFLDATASFIGKLYVQKSSFSTRDEYCAHKNVNPIRNCTLASSNICWCHCCALWGLDIAYRSLLVGRRKSFLQVPRDSSRNRGISWQKVIDHPPPPPIDSRWLLHHVLRLWVH